MKKNKLIKVFIGKKNLRKIGLIMRLSTFLFLISIFQVSATVYSQATRLSISQRNTTIKEVFNEIEKQSEFKFLYRKDQIDVNKEVSIHVKDRRVENILDDLLENFENVTYTVLKDNLIVITTTQKTYKVTGTLTSASTGETLPGVNIMIKGTSRGTISDADGNFTIDVDSPETVLAFSFIGYETQEIMVGNQTSLDIKMEESAIGINEVVTIGYGTIKKTDVTGSISSIKGDDLIEHPISTLEQGLQGMVTGVQITQSSGQPGSGMSVRIRGVGSIAGGTEPLYVIDGIPMYNSDTRVLNGLSVLNPGDIKSIEVLKDAVATSIYGSRAANGVILITTRTGESGKIRVHYDGYVGLQQVRKTLPMMNGTEYLAFAKEYFNNSSNIPPEQVEGYLKQLDDYGNANTDWQEELFQSAWQQDHNLSISGGTDKNQYYVSANYNDLNGVVKATDFKRYSLRLNMNTEVNRWLTVSTRAVVSKVIQNGFLRNEGTNRRNQGKSGMGSVLSAAPTSPVYDENGEFSSVAPYDFSFTDMENPIAVTKATDRNTMYNYQGGFDIKIKFFKGFTNTTRLGLDYTNKKSDTYYPKYLKQLGSQTAMLDKYDNFNIVLEDFITYKTKLTEKINLEVVAGASVQKETRNMIYLSGVGFPTDALENNAMQAATSQGVPVTNVIESTLASFFGRIHMDYAGKYLMSFNIRQDGASVFSDSNKWAIFPAFALGWRISEEDFFNISWFNNLKFRASWGETGNQAILPYQSLYIAKIVNTAQGAGAGLNTGLAPNLPNPNLTWETTQQLNIGADFGFLRNRIRSSFDYYVKKTTDLLANVQLPQSTGFNGITDNVGEVQNKGFEFSIGADVVESGDWRFSADFNFSRNKNVVLKTYENKDIITGGRGLVAIGSSSIVRVGEPLFSFYTIKYLGINENGHPIYEDVNEDGIINDADNQVSGSPFPDFIYGLNLNLAYKNFSLAMLWQGVSGNLINNQTLEQITGTSPSVNRIKNIKDYYPVLSDEIIIKNSDRFIEDGSYLRMKNIKLSYNVPIAKNILSNLTFYLSASNLITITNYSGYDPEVNSFSNINQYIGVDGAAYPSSRTFTFGVNVSF
jgi:TonB-linked SusC/RagA family outer membrane protein